MIKQRTVFETSDGKHFASEELAEAHEKLITLEADIKTLVESLSKSSQIQEYMRRAIYAWNQR